MRDRMIPRAWLPALAAAALLSLGPRAAADPDAVLSNLRVPLSGVLTVSLPGGGIDTVPLAGPLHVVTRVAPVDPCRTDVLANAQGVSGTGTSGRGYRLVGGFSTVAAPTDPCQKYRANLIFRLQSSQGDVALFQRVALDLTLDANRAVSTATAVFTGPGGDVELP